MARKEEQPPEPQLSAFEDELKKLQDAVSRLDSGDVTLEEALAQWEAGTRSYIVCRRILESAKSRVESLARSYSEKEPVWDLFEADETSADGRRRTDREE